MWCDVGKVAPDWYCPGPVLFLILWLAVEALNDGQFVRGFTRHGQLGVPGAADFGDWINSANAACAYPSSERSELLFNRPFRSLRWLFLRYGPILFWRIEAGLAPTRGFIASSLMLTAPVFQLRRMKASVLLAFAITLLTCWFLFRAVLQCRSKAFLCSLRLKCLITQPTLVRGGQKSLRRLTTRPHSILSYFPTCNSFDPAPVSMNSSQKCVSLQS